METPPKKRGPKKPHAGMFTKENPKPGPGRGKKVGERKIGQAIVEEMEKGYTTTEAAGETVGVKAARLLAKTDYPKFLTLYLKAKEMAGHREPPTVEDAVAAAATAEAGEKEERVEELARRLLTEWEAEDGK